MFGKSKPAVKQERSPLPRVSRCRGCGRETELCISCRQEYCPACDNHVLEVSPKLYRLVCDPKSEQRLFREQLHEIVGQVERELGKVRNGRYPDFSQTWSEMVMRLGQRIGRGLTLREQGRVWNALIIVFPPTAHQAKRWIQ